MSTHEDGQSEVEWYVFHERDDTYAVTVGAADGEEREVSVQKVTADSEDAAILAALSGRYALSGADWRAWAIPASEVRPRPFTIRQRTEYDPSLGPHFVR